jgi:serine/threonine-protein kinase HipA
MADYRAKVALGDALVPVVLLRFAHGGPRQFSTFAYDQAWIDNPRRFNLSPDIPLDGGP